MIVHMISGIAPDDARVQAVCAQAERYGLTAEVNVSQGTNFQVVEVRLKDAAERCSSTPEYPFETMDGVDRVVRVSPSLVSIARNGGRDPHHIKIGGTKIGQGLPVLPVVGPCTIDSHVGSLIAELARNGIRHVRGGFVKPRSRAESFRGLGSEGLRLLLEAARDCGIESVWTEVIDTSHIDDVRRERDLTGFDGSIVLWVGARTGNQVLLEKLGRQRDFAVMLKNGLRMRSIDELAELASFVLHGPMWWNEDGTLNRARSIVSGNHNLILCVRGLEKTDPHERYRFYLNATWITALHERTWAPVCFDPSHIAGKLENVRPVLATGLAAKPDIILLEAHDNPSLALCDGEQAVPMDQLPEILDMIEQHNRQLAEIATT